MPQAQTTKKKKPVKKPSWLRVQLPTQEKQKRFSEIQERFRTLNLHTVCEEARCPNIFECWGEGTATIMILGETCTRGCRFCSVDSGNPKGVVDPDEPGHTAQALSNMDLAYVVLTMVDRDDLLDGGAAHVARTVRLSKSLNPDLLIETLVGDFQGRHEDIETLVQEGAPDVFAHNVEVVPRLQRSIRDARCSWDRSIDALVHAKKVGANITKSSLMLGLGETKEEVIEALALLKTADVDVVTLGQYLQPTKKHKTVERFVTPEEFQEYETIGMDMGFAFVASGPLVRSSYRAAEAFLKGVLKGESQKPFDDRYGRKRHLNIV